MTANLLPVGTRVTHINQQRATSAIAPEGTGEILNVRGPYSDGTYEYLVLATRNFARTLGPDNPLEREAWWSSNAVRAVGSWR